MERRSIISVFPLGGDLIVSRKNMTEAVRSVLNPIWNAYGFFTLYANTDGYRATFRSDAAGVLDRYVLAKTRELVVTVTERMDVYDLYGACAAVTAYLDALNNWYIRRSRERFWSAEVDRDAFDTLFTALVTLTRVAAPLLPLVTDEVHRALVGGDSVHLDDWPDPEAFPADPELVASMDLVRQAASVALSLRDAEGLRVRLPLQRLTVAGAGADRLAPYVDLLREEVNVKEVELLDDAGALGRFRLRPDGAAIGPVLGGATQEVMRAAREGDWTTDDDGSATVGGHRLEAGQFELVLEAGDEGATAALPGNGAVVALDTTVTDELAAEGQARDVIRLVQQARKARDLAVTDRIRLTVTGPEATAAAVVAHEALVRSQVLADELEVETADGPVQVEITRSAG